MLLRLISPKTERKHNSEAAQPSSPLQWNTFSPNSNQLQAHASTSVTCSNQITTIFTTENILAWLVLLAERSKLILLQARWNAKEKRKVALGKKDILPAKKLLRTKNLLLKRNRHPKRKKVLKKPHHRLAILTFHEDYELKFDQNFTNDFNFAILLFQVFLIFHHDLTKTPILNQTVRIKTLFFFWTFFGTRPTFFSAFIYVKCVHFYQIFALSKFLPT